MKISGNIKFAVGRSDTKHSIPLSNRFKVFAKKKINALLVYTSVSIAKAIILDTLVSAGSKENSSQMLIIPSFK
jgi:hypothetical protein